MAEIEASKPARDPEPVAIVTNEAKEASRSPSLDEKKSASTKEKHSSSSTSHHNEKHKDEFDEEYNPNVTEPFPPMEGIPDEPHQLTIRALVVGAILGCVVGASNIYLGLKTGFTFGPQLFGAIFGFSILKPLSHALPTDGFIGRWFGGYFGPKENTTTQTSATAAGGLGILFVSAVPALYFLETMSDKPSKDFGKLVALTFALGYFGVFFVIPLRKYFILRQKLVFPTPTATAYTIRSLHSGRHGAEIAKKKAYALMISLVVCFCYKILSGYIPGIFLDWHIGWVLYRLGWAEAIKIENFGWVWEFTPAFFGAGMLSGMNASWSFLGGSVLAWGIIAPSIVKNGLAVGIPIDPENAPGYMSYWRMGFTDVEEILVAPSPRYWLLWPGVLIMLVFSFVEIGMSSRHMFVEMFHASKEIGPAIKRLFVTDPNYVPEEDIDPAPIEDRVKPWWWMVGLALSIILSCALLGTQFDVGVGETILALVLAFIFSFIGVQSSGDTDINPVSTVAKASQIVFGGVSKGQGMAEPPAQRLNLIAGAVAAGAAAQAVDMVGDLKTGHLLGAKPKVQFFAQLFGATIAMVLTPGLFVLFSTASPCILDGSTPCAYGAPSVAAWSAVAKAVTAPSLPVPKESGYTAIGLAIAAAVTVIAKHLWVPKKYWVYVPNWNAVGLAFVVQTLQYSIAMGAGSLFAFFWLKRNPKSFDMWAFAVSAGLLAGEGLGGVFQALLQVAGVGGGDYGLAVGCPLNEYCG